MLEEQLREEMAIGRSPSTIKTVLSAATWAVSMGIAKHLVPRFFWKYVKGVDNAWDDRKVPWGSVAALQTMAAKAQNPTDWGVVATTALSTVAGLRVGEMAGIKVRGLDGIRGTVTFWDEKVHRRAYNVGSTLGPVPPLVGDQEDGAKP